jgi:hypothetical protein
VPWRLSSAQNAAAASARETRARTHFIDASVPAASLQDPLPGVIPQGLLR